MSKVINVNRTCKGKRITAAQIRQDLEAKIKTLQQTDHYSPAWPAIEKKIAERQAGLDDMAKLHDDHEVGRMTCNYNLNTIIEFIPEDGEVYEAACPACGNAFTVRRTSPVDE